MWVVNRRRTTDDGQRKHDGRLLYVIFLALVPLLFLSSCKSCTKGGEAEAVKTDSSAAPAAVNTINLPHADTSLIPVFSKILDNAFNASAKKDYSALASLIVYMGPDNARFGKDVYNVKNSYDLHVMRITADVFNRWNSGIDSRDYARAFEYNQPGAMDMQVLEVLFVSRTRTNRKFFGFVKIGQDYKLADVTSSLEPGS